MSELKKWAESVVFVAILFGSAAVLFGGALMFVLWQLPEAIVFRCIIAAVVVGSILFGTSHWAEH